MNHSRNELCTRDEMVVTGEEKDGMGLRNCCSNQLKDSMRGMRFLAAIHQRKTEIYRVEELKCTRKREPLISIKHQEE